MEDSGRICRSNGRGLLLVYPYWPSIYALMNAYFALMAPRMAVMNDGSLVAKLQMKATMKFRIRIFLF